MRTLFLSRILPAVLIAVGVALAGAQITRADSVPTFRIELKDGVITPQRLQVPANKDFRIELHNAGTTPAEFESKGLRKEKVVPPDSTSVILIRKLAPGEYDLFDDFHPQGAASVLVAE